MTGLKFNSETAFAAAMTSGLVPDETLRSPVEFARKKRSSKAGQTRVELIVDARGLDDDTIGRLEKAGVDRASLPAERERAPWWPAVILPQPASADATSGVLFKADTPAKGLDLAASLLGLGATKLEIATFANGCLVHAVGASHYLVHRAMDREGGLSVFVRVAPDRDDVWIEAGFRHECLRGLRARPGHVVLVDGRGGVEHVAPSRFANALDAFDLELDGSEDHGAVVALGRHRLELRLTRAMKVRPASLWVLHKDGKRALDRLVESAPEQLLASLTFAALGDAEEPIILVRALAGATPPAFFEGDAYAPLPELGDVYAPADAVVHPPVGARRLRAAIGGPDDRLRWLQRTERGVRVDSAPISAFSPVIDWVELCASHADLEPWLKNVSFDPIAFEIVDRTDEAPRSRRKPTAESVEDKPAERKRRPREAEEPAVLEVREEVVTREPAAGARTKTQARAAGAAEPAQPDVEARLVEVERRFGQSDLALAAPERDEGWLELADLYRDAGHGVDARMCWGRVIFDGRGGAARARQAYLDAALGWRRVDAAKAWATAVTGRTPEDVELTAALLLSSSNERPAQAHLDRASAILDAADVQLDIRTAWLARAALAKLSGDDALLLARARDRAIGRLESGLSLGRDLPRAVRALDVSGAADRLRSLAETLAFFEATPRAKGPLEADPRTTLAYVRLVFACAIARTGDAPRARWLLDAAAGALPAGDAIHSLLSQSFAARVQQAIEAESDSAPLPADITARYEALGRLDRYKVDRVRQACKLLEPDPDLDPFRSFGMAEKTGSAEAIARVAAATKPSDAARALDEIFAACEAETNPAQRRRRLATATTALLYAPSSVAASRVDLAERVAATFEGPDRVRSLAGAMAVAERLERSDLVDALLARLPAEIAALPPPALPPLAPHVAKGAAALRRRASHEDAERLLRDLTARIVSNDAPARVARLVLTRTLVELGARHAAEEEIASELKFVESSEVSPADRLQLARSIASCAAASADFASVRKVAALWKRMTDSYNTNTHLCLSAVELADAIAWSLAPRRGDTSSLARQLADDDEHAVRAAIFG